MAFLKPYFKVSLEKELEQYSRLNIEDIAEIQQWLRTQSHLPTSPDILVAHFLLASNYDMEVAKKAIKLNFEYKRSITDFFDEWDPLSEAVLDQANHVMYFAFLPRKSPSQPRLCLSRFKERSSALFDLAQSVKWLLMSYQSLLFHEGQQEFVLVVDGGSFTVSHGLKLSYRILRQYEGYFTNAAPMRTKEFHFLNTNGAVRNLIQFARMFISKKSVETTHLHGAPKEYFDSVHPDCVPKDYGGTGPSLESLHEANKRRVLDTRNALIAFCNFK